MNFVEEAIYFESGWSGITLAGTLLKPSNQKKDYPPILLIAGYGKNDRNCTGLGHQYFKTIAEYFAHQGFPVFRYDKRGVGQSQGTYETATSHDFMIDADAACDMLRQHDDLDTEDGIIVIGHSEGGLIASMLYADRGDIICSVMIAPALVNSGDYFVQTMSQQLQADGATNDFVKKDNVIRRQVYDIVMQEQDKTVAAEKMRQVISDWCASLAPEEAAQAEKLPFAFTSAKMDMQIAVFNDNWYRYFWSLDIGAILKSCHGPMLALCGDKDNIIIPAEIEKVMKQDCYDYSEQDQYCFVKVMPDLNHRLQRCTTGALAEYMTIDHAIDEQALQVMHNWLKIMI